MTPIDKIPSDQKPKAKRFWTETSLDQDNDGYIITLDGREVKTPQGSAMRVPQRSLADAICQEWDGQKEEIIPESMPMFKFTVTAIDRVTPQRGAIVQNWPITARMICCAIVKKMINVCQTISINLGNLTWIGWPKHTPLP